MYQKIKAKFKANPTIFYACSIVASWAGVGSLMNFRTLAINNGAAAAIIWAVFNSLACIFFGLFAEYIPTVRRIMQSKVMFYFIGFLTVFQTWTQMSGIYEIFGDTPIGTTGGTLIVYGTCLVFLFMLLKEGMIRNVLSDGFSWVVVYGLLAVVVIAALVYTHGAFVNIDPGLTAAGIQTGLYKGFLLLPGPFTYEMILSGELDPKQLTVTFIDEEGLYPSMVDAAHRWRRNFLSVGAKFLWFCLPFKQVCVIDHLSASESWITWEPGKEDVWMRTPPDFAIRYSPYLHHPGEMNYQTFCEKAFRDGIQLVGLRTAESLTRFKCIANTKMERITKGGKFYPIYDWVDSDVWLYIKERNLEFPEIYMRLYEAGVHKNALRLCAFFGDTSTQGLRWVAETDNDLWERIQRREPNAYLVLLYWDSEMFRRSTRKRRELEADTEQKDYKALCKDLLFLHPERYTIAKDTLSHIDHWRGLFIKTYGIAEQKHYKTMYEGLLYGDPKMRILRILWTTIYNDHNARIKEEQNHGKH